MHEDVEVVAGLAGVLADQARVIGFLHGGEQGLRLSDVFAANVDVGGARAHRETGDQRALDQLVRIVADDFAVSDEPGSDSSALMTREAGRRPCFPWA